MQTVDDFRLRMGRDEFVPIIVGGMGVDISTADLALEACRLGGIGHISDAMIGYVSDRHYGTRFAQRKADLYTDRRDGMDKSGIKFNLEDLRQAQINHVRATMERKAGPGGIFVNVMEKLTMADPRATLEARLLAAMDGGIDGITLSAGLHSHSLKIMEGNPRFRDVRIGIIVSSWRALKIFLRSGARCNRLPDYVVVEGPLAGGHLGFGEDWHRYRLPEISREILQELRAQELDIPVIAAGGIFTGSEAVDYLQAGCSGVQVATRFTVTRECGLPEQAKQKYFSAREEEVVVTTVSPTGYPLRMLACSPCLDSQVPPACEPFGYALDHRGQCAYLDAYQAGPCDEAGRKLPIRDKICLCLHFSKHQCYTCGHYVFRLKDTTRRRADGSYQVLTAEHVFNDYQFSKDGAIALPEPESAPARVAGGLLG